MKLQFVIGNDMENTVDIDVTREPTPIEAEAIENEICRAVDEYEKENGDFSDFDWCDCIYRVVEKYIPIAENRVVKTFWI